MIDIVFPSGHETTVSIGFVKGVPSLYIWSEEDDDIDIERTVDLKSLLQSEVEDYRAGDGTYDAEALVMLDQIAAIVSEVRAQCSPVALNQTP